MEVKAAAVYETSIFSLLFPKILLILLIFAASLSPALAHTCTGIPDAECNALYALYESTNGDQWTDNTNWLTAAAVGSWYGITIEGGHVVEIDFWDNGLFGELPPELGNLTELRSLAIYSSGLSGVIPPELGNLANLERLDLWGNMLSGNIPVEICSLKNLRSLDVGSNRLTGEIRPELANLTNLEGLGLGYNKFSGSIPSWLGNLTNLEGLGLSHNLLTGPIPSELGNLNELERLGLDENKLTGEIPPELGNLTSLMDLGLRTNRLTGPIPPELGNLTGLNGLDLSRNQLTGTIPPELSNLTGIMYLVLEYNNLTGPIPPELGNLAYVQNLNLNSNNLCGDLPSWLANPPPSYFWIDLRWNRLYSTNTAVLASMESWNHGKFLSTQTLPPINITAATVEDSGSPENRVQVSWNQVSYIEDPGGYQVYYRKEGGSEYHYGGMTPDKETTSIAVSNLEPGADYDFLVKTVTWNHGYNGNVLTSEESATASASAGSLNRAFIPVWKQSPNYFTGVVVSNFGDTDFDLKLTSYGPNGGLQTLGQNPAYTKVEAGRQKSLLGVEFFQGNPAHTDFSWIELGVENSNRMGSIFLFGDNDPRMLDGAEAQHQYAQKLYFTRPLDENFFQGWNADIQMCIVNPTDEEVRIICWMKGSSREFGKSYIIPPKGFVKGTSRELIPNYYEVTDGYMEVEVTDGPGVIGFSRVEFPGVLTALGFNAVEVPLSEKMYSAQLAHGANIVTNLQLVNTNAGLRNVKLTPIADDGSLLAPSVWVTILGNKTYNANLGELFHLAGDGVITTGSLVVESFGNGVTGDIVFAEGETMEYAMSLPLQSELFQEAVFNHISSLPTVFTGFAFFNPGEETATVLIEAFNAEEGDKVAEKTLVLGPGERIARILTDPDIWPDFEDQSGGFIRIQSDQPIAGQQLFGDRDLRYMAAVPPTTSAEAMFD